MKIHYSEHFRNAMVASWTCTNYVIQKKNIGYMVHVSSMTLYTHMHVWRERGRERERERERKRERLLYRLTNLVEVDSLAVKNIGPSSANQ